MSDKDKPDIITSNVKNTKRKPSFRRADLSENVAPVQDVVSPAVVAEGAPAPLGLNTAETVVEWRKKADDLLNSSNIDSASLPPIIRGHNDLDLLTKLIGVRTFMWSLINNNNLDTASARKVNSLLKPMDKMITKLLLTDDFAALIEFTPIEKK